MQIVEQVLHAVEPGKTAPAGLLHRLDGDGVGHQRLTTSRLPVEACTHVRATVDAPCGSHYDFFLFFDSVRQQRMNTAKVTSKGQVTIPKQVRELLAIETGDRLAFELEGDGRLRVSRILNESRPLRGLLSEYAKGHPVDDEQVRAALRRRAAAKYAVR